MEKRLDMDILQDPVVVTTTNLFIDTMIKRELKSIPFKYIVTFEGTDCSFKETNANKLVNYIQDELGYKAKLFSFPYYDSQSSYLLRNYFKNTRHIKEVSPEMISMLYAFDFYDNWYNKIKSYCDLGYIIIMDRWIYSNIYYQGVRALQKLRSDLSVENLRYYLDSNELKDFIDIYENIIYKEMELPDTNIMFKMIHDKKSTKELIEERKSKHSINEDNFKYLELVNELFRNLFTNTSYCVKEIRLDKNTEEFRSPEDIFNEIKLEFETNFKHHLKQMEIED